MSAAPSTGAEGRDDRAMLEIELAAAQAEIARLHYELGSLDSRLARDMVVARRIQLSMLPHHFPQCFGWRMAAGYQAAREVGGDFYDAFELTGRKGRLAIVVG